MSDTDRQVEFRKGLAAIKHLSLAPAEWQRASERLGSRGAFVVFVDKLPPSANGESAMGWPVLSNGVRLILISDNQSEREQLMTLAHECYHQARDEVSVISERKLIRAPWLKGQLINEPGAEAWAEAQVRRAEYQARDRIGLLQVGASEAYWRAVLDAIGE